MIDSRRLCQVEGSCRGTFNRVEDYEQSREHCGVGEAKPRLGGAEVRKISDAAAGLISILTKVTLERRKAEFASFLSQDI
jgi:hypothetical protein